MTTALTGVILDTGEHGTGKTRYGLESGDLEKTIMVDDDLKGRGTTEGIKRDLEKQKKEIGQYIDFIRETDGLKPNELHQVGLRIIDSIPENNFEVLLWDTWTRFAESCRFYVMSHPEKFREANQWAAQGKIKGGEMNKVAVLYEAELIAKLQAKVPLVILTSHLKNQYLNGTQTGKEIPAVSKAVARVCNLRLWLRHNPASTTPIALVLKNIEKNILVNGKLRTIQVLPTKITPLCNEDNFERSLWDSIERYIANPIGNRKPTKDETPDDFEMSIVQGILTEDQRLSWLYALKGKKQDEQEEQLLLMQSNKEKAVAMQKDDKNFMEIATELKMSLKDVVEMLA